MKTTKYYANNKSEALSFAKNYDMLITYGTGTCACGESMAVKLTSDDNDEEIIIIICQSCWNNATFIDKL